MPRLPDGGYRIDERPYILYSPVCDSCSNWTPRPDARRTCLAYPDNAIPLEIWAGERRHNKPYPGDRGIQYEREKR
jgi:hypothetical protein